MPDAAVVVMSADSLSHGCAEIDYDDEGWWYVVCDCGKQFAELPDLTTAVDALLGHALEEVSSSAGTIEPCG